MELGTVTNYPFSGALGAAAANGVIGYCPQFSPYVGMFVYHQTFCGLQGVQGMTMDGGAYPYDVHDLGLYLDWEGTVYSYRAGATVNLQ
jgi:hypothetical protein